MDRKTERAYKRKCFQGRGAAACWLDRTFFAALSGACLYILLGKLLLSLLLLGAVMLLLILWDRRRWMRFRDRLMENARRELRRESWLGEEAARIRQAGGTILYPTPDVDGLTGTCLRLGPDAALHCMGEPQDALIARAAALGCVLTFHPWGQGADASREAVTKRLERDAPKRRTKLWGNLLRLPGNRYLLTGGLLLLLSIVLRRALYWRLLGSVCLLIGAVRRSFHTVAQA